MHSRWPVARTLDPADVRAATPCLWLASRPARIRKSYSFPPTTRSLRRQASTRSCPCDLAFALRSGTPRACGVPELVARAPSRLWRCPHTFSGLEFRPPEHQRSGYTGFLHRVARCAWSHRKECFPSRFAGLPPPSSRGLGGGQNPSTSERLAVRRPDRARASETVRETKSKTRRDRMPSFPCVPGAALRLDKTRFFAAPARCGGTVLRRSCVPQYPYWSHTT